MTLAESPAHSVRITSPRSLRGDVRVPGDKSISHRAALLNSIADGVAEVGNYAPGADCRSTLGCLERLGVRVQVQDGGRVQIHGVGLEGLRESSDVLDCGNSGTTMRLLSGLLAGMPFLSVLSGDGSLRSRPMARVVEPLRAMGAQVWGRDRDRLAPLAIRGGNLRGMTYRAPVASAQVKSAVLLAGLSADGPTEVIEPAPSRDHTERMLAAMGASLGVSQNGVRLEQAPGRLASVSMSVPGDFSSAASWLAAGCLHPDARVVVSGVGLNPGRTGLLSVLREMGARVRVEHERQEGGEPVGDLVAESSELRGVDVEGALIPSLIDELPLLAVLACFAVGTTTVRDAAELRHKESDRIAAMASQLSRMGASIEERPDGWVIQGSGVLHEASIESFGDHRVAMALAVAGMVSQGVNVSGAECVVISYPSFWEDVAGLGADLSTSSSPT